MNQEYRKMNLLEPMIVLLKHWWFILILTVIAAGVAYYVTTEVIEPKYKASTTLFIGKESDGLAELSFYDLEVGNQLVMDYQQLIQTDLIAEQVIKDLSLSMTPEDFKEYLSVETIEDSRFMNVSYKDKSPKLASEVANSLSEVLADKAVQIVGVQNIQIVDYAKIPKKPTNPSVPLNVVVGSLIGFVIAIMFVAIQTMSNSTIQEEDEIEKGFGLPVLGSIPKLKGRASI